MSPAKAEFTGELTGENLKLTGENSLNCEFVMNVFIKNE